MNSASTYHLGVSVDAGRDRAETAGCDSVAATPESMHAAWDDCCAELGRLVLAMGVAPDRVDDLLQDAYVVALQKPPRLTENELIRRWLFRVVANRCRLEHRRKGRWRRTWNKLSGWWRVDDGQPAADHVVSRSEQRELVREALAQLPDPSRTIVVLRYFSGFNSKEISDILAIPDNTVRSHLRRGRLQLAAALEHLELSDEPMS